jgi:2-polyprenyl-6-methoxyphenol hydroxylase-like FAD-dependent oxidoreductase
MTPSVLIVGAGPTGLALACFLLEAGIACQLIDKRADMSFMTRAVGVNHTGARVLEQLGVLEAVLKEAIEVEELLVYWNRKRIVSLDHGCVCTVNQFLYCPQPIIERHLIARLYQLGGEIHRQVELVSFKNDKDGVEVNLNHGGVTQTANYDLMFACDGGQSKIRKHLQIDCDIADYQADFLLVDVTLEKALPKTEYFLDELGYIMLVPLPMNQCRIILSVKRESPVSFDTDFFTAAFIQEQCLARTGKKLPILNIVWTTFGALKHQIASRVIVDTVVIMGDAAHLFSPVGGTNMNMGLQDAMSFNTICLNQHRKIEKKALKIYERERCRAIQNNLIKTKAFTDLILRQHFNQTSLEINFLPAFQNRHFIRNILPSFFCGNFLKNESSLIALLKE